MSNIDNSNPMSLLINQNDPNVNMQLRQRLALAMLSRRKSAAPKNIGEGIYSFANSLDDAMLERSILGQDVAAQAAGQKTGAEIQTMLPPQAGAAPPPAPAPAPAPPPAPPPQARSFAPTGPQVSAPAAPPPQPQPSMMAMAPSQPDQILGPDPTASTPPPQPQQPPPQPASMITAPPMGQPRGDGTVDPNEVNAIDAQANDPWPARSRSIAGIESGGAKDPYTTLGAQTRTGDRAIGKYQIMGANVPSWTEAALGQRMTPEEFRNDSAAQEAVFKHRFGGYVDKYGEAGAAKAWYAGEKGMQNPNATDLHGRLTVADYGNDYLRRLGMPDPGPRDRIAAAMPPAGPAQPSGGAQAISPPPTALTDPNAPAGSGGLPPVITDGPGSRGSIANTMVAQAQPPAPPPPQAGGATTQPPAPTGIQKAPDEVGRPGYVTPPQAPLPERQQAPIPPQMLKLQQMKIDAMNRGNDYQVRQIDSALGQWQRYYEHQQKNIDQADERAARIREQKVLEREKGLQTSAGRALDVRKGEQGIITPNGAGAPPPLAGPMPPGAPPTYDTRLGTPQSPQRSGPRADPPPPGVIPEQWAKAQQDDIIKTKAGYETGKPELNEFLDLIKQAREHPAKPWGVGMTAGISKLTPSGQGFAAIMDQIGGKNLLAAYQKIKGTGAVSTQEGENVAKAQARLTTAQSKEDFDSALDDLNSTLRGAVERTERKLGVPVTAWQKKNDDDYAPDVGEIGVRGGKRVEYIGGDPSKSSSYRTPR